MDTTPPSLQPSGWRRLFARPHRRAVWVPLLAALACLALSIISLAFSRSLIGLAGGIGYQLGLLWLVGLSVARFVRKQIAPGFIALAALVLGVCIPTFIGVIGFAYAAVKGDDFAVDLVLPEGVELAEPLVDSPADEGDPDAFQTAILDPLAVSGSDDPTLEVSLSSLAVLDQDHPELLERYLATHPAWRVGLEKGQRFAIRRWKIDGRWEVSDSGYHSSFHPPDDPRYQTRTRIGFSEGLWRRASQKFSPGVPAQAKLSDGNSLFQSSVGLPAGSLWVEQFEQSGAPERRITRAAFTELEKEFGRLLEDPTWSGARALLPTDAILMDAVPPSLDLHESSEPGIYDVVIRANPGEPGVVFLKAWEITKNQALSAGRLEERSTEWIGWSDVPEERFLSASNITIYEGDWGQFYGARFEVWFRPDSGAPERKLVERNFKIEGWMR